jgi:hypothetical protein
MGTVVIRDGDSIVVGIDADSFALPEGGVLPTSTLLFYMASESTPCVDCIDDRLAFAKKSSGGKLDPRQLPAVLSFAAARCKRLGHRNRNRGMRSAWA